jgi:hypothetical protein
VKERETGLCLVKTGKDGDYDVPLTNFLARITSEEVEDDGFEMRRSYRIEVAFGGVDVRVNALGLRGVETTLAPAPGAVRILVLGDSVVFGQGVALDETFPARLAVRLGARWQMPVEALNAGAQGYDTVAEAAAITDPCQGSFGRSQAMSGNLDTYPCVAAWSDICGFGSVLSKARWNLQKTKELGLFTALSHAYSLFVKPLLQVCHQCQQTVSS